MQRHAAAPGPSVNRAADAPPTQVKDPYVPPVIPMGLPHVVQYVTGSLLHMPGAFQLMADRMSRYANADGRVSIALEFLCKISDLGSKNTAKGYIDKLTAMEMLEAVHGQGGNDRKSNTYRFLGAKRHWRPMPGEEPGTDPWITLLEVRLENEGLKQQVQDLTAKVALLTNGGAVGHPEVTNGDISDGPESTDSYETATPQGAAGAIGHSRVTNGGPPEAAETPSHSYEHHDSDDSPGEDAAIGHLEVTNGGPSEAAETPSHSYETYDSDDSPGEDAAIGHLEVTNGGRSEAAKTPSHSYETPDPDGSQEEDAAIDHSKVTDGPTEGQEYLERRTRVETLVMEFRDHYARSFRGGVSSAVHHFSLTPENERDLLLQVETLRVDREAAAGGPSPPPETEEPEPSGRRGVEPCPDCDRPFTTHGGAEYCPDCTERRRRGGRG